MRTSDFDFVLPPELIAQEPAAMRDASRLLVHDRATGMTQHRSFRDLLSFLRAGDLLVLNDSRVIPARLHAIKSTPARASSSATFEILLLEAVAKNDWWTMMRPGKRAPVGSVFTILDPRGEPASVTATVVETNSEGHRRLHFTSQHDIVEMLDDLGEIPLPPYIRRDPAQAQVPSIDDRARYQTVYANAKGSVAAPTAGLHFTPGLLADIRAHGVEIARVTLHVGLGTFAPVKAERLDEHVMHHERFDVSAAAADAVNAAKAQGRRIIAVGTTSVRVLESGAAAHNGRMVPGAGRTNIFIHPPYVFRVVDALLTNFHLPQSTLLMLVSALAAPGRLEGREAVLRIYHDAIRERYRFFSYGDAMLLL